MSRLKEFAREMKKDTNKVKQKKSKERKKGGRRVMEETARADGEQAGEDKWREWA